MAPTALGPSLPDAPTPNRFAIKPIGTPRRATSLAGGSANMPTEMSNQEHVRALWDRFHFNRNTEIKDQFVEEVLHRYGALVDELDELRRNDAQSGIPLAVQSELSAYKAELASLQSLVMRDPYVLVLIDGDGMVFDDDLLRMGEEGGRKAAYQLKTRVTQWLLSVRDDCPPDFTLVARVYANVRGLADTLFRAGIISSTTIFEGFVRGFTRGDELCDFIDVGAGKDRADIKMDANFRVHIHDYTCRQIIFGCSHDDGYARLLEKYLSDPGAQNRVTLLEGVAFGKELSKLPFAHMKLLTLFRDSTIQSAAPGMGANLSRNRQDSKHSPRFNPESSIFTPSHTPAPTTPLFSPKSSMAVTELMSMRGEVTRTNSVGSSTTLSETAGPHSGGGLVGGAWAYIARGSAKLPFKDLTKKSGTSSNVKVSGCYILLNKDGMRIDREMEYDHDKVYKLKQIKLCNQHYIGRGCCHFQAKNAACPHRHDLKLSDTDLKWLRVVARETVCKKGTGCLELDCIYGHHCPYPKMTEGSLRGVGCINGDNCRFAKEMHGMDMKVAQTLTEKDLLMDDYF